MVWAEIWKVSEFFIWKFSVLRGDLYIYLNRRVFVMCWNIETRSRSSFSQGAGYGYHSVKWQTNTSSHSERTNEEDPYRKSLQKTRLLKYIEKFTTKKETVQIENFDIFIFLLKNIDCGHSLEPPHRGGSNECQQSMFSSRNKENNAKPCKLQFY